MAGILITGGAGIIGSLVTRRLVEKGIRPVVYDLNPDTRLIKDILPGVALIRGNVLDMSELIEAIKTHGIDHIIHLATVIDPTMQLPPKRTYEVMVQGTVNVFEASRLMGIKRVVAASSKAVYSDAAGEYAHPTYRPITEDYPKFAPNCTLYGVSKLFCERYGTVFMRKHGIEIVFLRFASTFSPGKTAGHGPLASVSRIIDNAIAGKPTVIAKGGDQKEDFVYSKDVATALVLACFAAPLEHNIFHIGSGAGHTLGDVAAIVKRFAPGAAIEIGPGLDFLGIGIKAHFIFDINRARKELGYEPQYSLEAGIKDYIDTIRDLRYLES